MGGSSGWVGYEVGSRRWVKSVERKDVLIVIGYVTGRESGRVSSMRMARLYESVCVHFYKSTVYDVRLLGYLHTYLATVRTGQGMQIDWIERSEVLCATISSPVAAASVDDGVNAVGQRWCPSERRVGRLSHPPRRIFHQ